MVEPKSIAYSPDRWLTDSRVYNLIWMGRWLERADNIARVVNTFARMAVENGSEMPILQQSLRNAAAIRGIPIDDDWFHQEALSEEEVYRRFVQQQQ